MLHVALPKEYHLLLSSLFDFKLLANCTTCIDNNEFSQEAFGTPIILWFRQTNRVVVPNSNIMKSFLVYIYQFI